MTEEKDRRFSPLATGVLAVFCCVLWGSAVLFIKMGYRLFAIAPDDTGAIILFAGLRFMLAGILVILTGSLLQKRALIPKKTEWGMIFKQSLLQTTLQYYLYYVGVAHTTGVKSAIITGSNSLLTILIACLLFHQETLTFPKIVGCVMGFTGVVLANLTGEGMSFSFRLPGEGFVFLSCISYGLSSALIKHYSRFCDPVLLSGWQFLIGGITMTIGGFLMGGQLTTVSAPALAVLFYLAFVSAAAYTIWGILLKYNPVSQVAIYGFFNPVVGVLASALFLEEGGQAFSLQYLGALLLVSAGIYVVNRFHS